MCKRLALLNTAILYYPFKYSYLIYIDLVLDNFVLDSTVMPYIGLVAERKIINKIKK